jgi:hypothetical protein
VFNASLPREPEISVKKAAFLKDISVVKSKWLKQSFAVPAQGKLIY